MRCPGGDYSCYQCLLCERYVEPFSNEDGDLLCEYCEVRGLVMLNTEDLDHLEQVREFARAAGLSKQLERQLHYLAGYGQSGNQCVLGKDFAPHSFSFAMYRPGTKEARKFIFNGGLIFQGPSCPADGSFPSLTVSLASGTGWFCHT
jgi:DNA-directed RNA polymerase subunit RPC12/RpoP